MIPTCINTLSAILALAKSVPAIGTLDQITDPTQDAQLRVDNAIRLLGLTAEALNDPNRTRERAVILLTYDHVH